jgi:hypothetical protein
MSGGGRMPVAGILRVCDEGRDEKSIAAEAATKSMEYAVGRTA